MVMQYLPEAVWLVQYRSPSRLKQWTTHSQQPDQSTAILVARQVVVTQDNAPLDDELVRVVRMAPSSVIYVNGHGEARIQQ